jgi:hypothetical protein
MRIGTDIDHVEMVTTDDGGYIPAQYQKFLEVFSKEQGETLPPRSQIDNTFDLEPGHKVPYGWIYNLSGFGLSTQKAYIETNLVNFFVQLSPSSATVAIPFAKIEDVGLWL